MNRRTFLSMLMAPAIPQSLGPPRNLKWNELAFHYDRQAIALEKVWEELKKIETDWNVLSLELIQSVRNADKFVKNYEKAWKAFRKQVTE